MKTLLLSVAFLIAVAAPSQGAPRWIKGHRSQMAAVSAAMMVVAVVLCKENKATAPVAIVTAPYSKLRIGVYQ